MDDTLLPIIYLVGRQQWEVIRWVGDDVSLAAGVTRGGRVAEPVETDAQHAVGAERGHEQVAVLAGLAELRQRTVVQRDLTHSTSIPGTNTRLKHKLTNDIGNNLKNANLSFARKV